MTRKPYRAAMTRSWWVIQRDYRVYMLREATVLPLLFFVACLVFGLFRLQQGEAGWQQWLAWMQQPWVGALNALALLAALFHAWTFFKLVPQVLSSKLLGWSIPAWSLIAAQWAAVACVFLWLGWWFGGWP